MKKTIIILAFLSVPVLSLCSKSTVETSSVYAAMHECGDQDLGEFQENDVDNEILQESLSVSVQKRSFIQHKIDSARLLCSLTWYKIKEACTALYVYCTTKKK